MLTRSLRNLLVGAMVGVFGLTSGLAVDSAYAAQRAPKAHAATAKKHQKARKHAAKRTTKKHRKAAKHTRKHHKAKTTASARRARA